MPWPVASPSTTSSPCVEQREVERVAAGELGRPRTCRRRRSRAAPASSPAACSSARRAPSRAPGASFSPSISASVMRTRCSATAHCAASAVASSLVVGVEDAVRLVQHLHHADEHVLVVDQRQRQHAARAVAGAPVDVRIEARVGVAVGHVDDLAVARAGADEARCRPARAPARCRSRPRGPARRSRGRAARPSRARRRSTCFAAVTTSASIVIRSNGAASALVTSRIASRSRADSRRGGFPCAHGGAM